MDKLQLCIKNRHTDNVLSHKKLFRINNFVMIHKQASYNNFQKSK